MATATTPTVTTQRELRYVRTSSIMEQEGFNPRTSLDAGEVEQLAKSIARDGLLQPVLVTEVGDETYVLVAGHKRLAASLRAGLEEVPVSVVAGEDAAQALHFAVVENLQRSDLNPIDEARGFDRLLRQEGLRQKDLAERLSVSQAHVSERLRLLTLPEGVQELIAGERVPARLRKVLAPIAKASEAVAVACAREIAQGEFAATDFEVEPWRLLNQLADIEEGEETPFVLAAGSFGGLTLAYLPDEVIDEELRTRDAAIGGGRYRLDRDDRDAACAYGCALSYEGDYASTTYVFDPAWVADRFRSQLDGLEEAAANRTEVDASSGSGAPVVDRGAERARAKEDADVAYAANIELGRALERKYGSVPVSRDVARMLADLILSKAPGLGAAGARLVREEWQEATCRTFGSGEERTRVDYLDADAADDALREWVLRPRKADEVIGRLVQALLAGVFADEKALPRSKRVLWSLPGIFGAERVASEVAEKLARRALPSRFTAAGD